MINIPTKTKGAISLTNLGNQLTSQMGMQSQKGALNLNNIKQQLMSGTNQNMNNQMNQGYPNQNMNNQMNQGYPNQNMNNQSSAGVGVSLKKGQKVSLSQYSNGQLNSVLVGLGWDINNTGGQQYDLDSEVFMLGADNKVIADDWFVFYNQPMSPDGSIQHKGDNRTGQGHGDDEVIFIDLNKVDQRVQKIVFVVTIHEAMQRGHNFSQVSNAYIRVVNNLDNQEMFRYNLTDYYQNVTSMVVGQLYRHSGTWKFNPVGDGTADDLYGLCARYGVRINE